MIKKFRRRWGAIVAACLALTGGAVSAGQYTVGVEAIDYLPLYKGEGSNYSGFARDVLDAFGAKHGHQFTYKPLPVSRLFEEFLTNKSLDFKFPDSAGWAAGLRTGVNVSYSEPVIHVTEGVFVQPAQKGKAAGDLKRLATIRGFTAYPYLDRIKGKTLAVSETPSGEAALSMVLLGRADGAYLNQHSARYLMTDVMGKPDALVFDPGLPTSSAAFTLSTLKHAEVVRQLSEFIAREKDTMARIRAKYKIAN